MKKYFLTALFTLGTFSIISVQAQEFFAVTCDGAVELCSLPKFLEMIRNVFAGGLSLAVLYGVFRIAYVGAKYGWKSDDPSARSEFRNNSLVILISLLALAALLPMTTYTLKKLNVDARVTNPIDCVQKAGSPGCPTENGLKVNLNLFPHAYAQTQNSGGTQNVFPQTVKMNGSIYDYFFLIFQMLIRVLFVALILLWVYAGFSLVAARGNPTEIEKGKNRLWYSVFLTVILLLVQVLLVSLKGAIIN